jgi:hypothetical protein
MIPSKSLNSSILVLAFLSGVLGLSGCGSKEKKNELAKLAETPDSAKPTAVLGYNYPQEFNQSVGLRAAAAKNQLVISVLNNSADQIIVGPKSFRVILPTEQYALDQGNLDLSFFPVRTLNPGENGIFSVIIPRFEALSGNKLALNYPPKGILMAVTIEEASSNTTIVLEEPEVIKQ